MFRYLNGISFNFFIHGDNHVCMTVTIQRQPSLLKLSNAHFSNSKKQPVLLGPWSLRAFLLPNQPLAVSALQLEASKDQRSFGEGSLASSLNYGSIFDSHEKSSSNKSSLSNMSFKEIQAAITKQWNDWKKFQALPVDGTEDIAEDFVPDSSGNANRRVPKMVLVEIDGVKMFYPSCFVAVLVEEDLSHKKPPSKKLEELDPLNEEDREVEQIFANAAKKNTPKSSSKGKLKACFILIF